MRLAMERSAPENLQDKLPETSPIRLPEDALEDIPHLGEDKLARVGDALSQAFLYPQAA
jgi:hypothetical protein